MDKKTLYEEFNKSLRETGTLRAKVLHRFKLTELVKMNEIVLAIMKYKRATGSSLMEAREYIYKLEEILKKCDNEETKNA